MCRWCVVLRAMAMLLMMGSGMPDAINMGVCDLRRVRVNLELGVATSAASGTIRRGPAQWALARIAEESRLLHRAARTQFWQQVSTADASAKN